MLGFEARTDAAMGEGFRWLTVGHPSQPELEVTLITPGRRSMRTPRASCAASWKKGRWAGSA